MDAMAGVAGANRRWGIIMAGASAEGEQNPWPAFVDVLTTVIMVVTFLLVIMSAAVMQLSSQIITEVKESVSGEAVERLRTELEQTKAELEKALKSQAHIGSGGGEPARALEAVPLTQNDLSQGDLRRAVASRLINEDGRFAVDSPNDKPVSGGTRVETADALLTVTFEEDAVQVSDAVIEDSIATLRRANVGPDAHFEVWSLAPIDGALSEAQRRAYFRALSVRNILIRAGVNARNITAQVRVVQSRGDGHTVRVVLKPPAQR